MSDRPKIIGVCLSTIHSEDRFHFIKALNQCAVQKGYRLLVFNSCSDLYEPDNLHNIGEISLFRLIPYDMLSALIIFPHFLFNNPIVDEIATECRSRHIPLISIDKHLEGSLSFSFAYADTFEQLCQHVIREHHTEKLFMVAGMKGNQFSDERIAAFKKALQSNGIPYDDNLVGYGNFWDGPTLDVLKQWFETEHREIPDAIVCANDTMAVTVSAYLQEHGYRVPEDCIVTGFDNVEHAKYHFPHLTTCGQNYSEMGQRILEAVQTLAEGGTYPSENTVDFNIIYSQSCGCEPVVYNNINAVVQDIFGRMWYTNERHKLMCDALPDIANLDSLSELPKFLIDKFIFHTAIVAVNEDMFAFPEFGLYHKGEQAFSQNMQVHFQRYAWDTRDACTIPKPQLVPDWDALLEHEEPILVCFAHFLDLVYGYCVFQTDIIFEEYDKINTFMHSIDASLGSYHAQAQIKSMNAELSNLYIHDHMTGLLNRRGFYQQFNERLEVCSDHSGEVLLISIDLDGLKYINDTFGHIEGDNAIITVSKALSECAENGEICVRFGGDEFAAITIVPEKAKDHFERFATHFRMLLKDYNTSSAKPYQVEASIGFCAETLTENFDLDRMIKIADEQMYADKISRKKQRI